MSCPTHIEQIAHEGRLLAYVIRRSHQPSQTAFVTGSDANLQVGFVVYPSQATIARHLHLPVKRHTVGTSEVLLVRQGRCEADIYDDQRTRVATLTLEEGDVLVLLAGGHGFRTLADTVLLEVKQGPYLEQNEKEHF